MPSPSSKFNFMRKLSRLSGPRRSVSMDASAPFFDDKENCPDNTPSSKVRRFPPQLRKSVSTTGKALQRTALTTLPVTNECAAEVQTLVSIPNRKRTFEMTSEQVMEMLTAEEAGKEYYEILAETRRKSLENAILENERLYDMVDQLSDEVQELKSILNDALELITVIRGETPQTLLEKAQGNDEDDDDE